MLNLTEYITEQRKKIDRALRKALPPEASQPTILHQAMHYSLFSGGKRLRPILTLAAADAVNSPYDVMLPACAVEILHTYTLIHDDLPCMDDDDMRRGKPTCHIKFGEANAVLAGDALQALAFKLTAQSPHNPADSVLELARAAGSHGVVGGQVADISAGNHPTEQEISFIHKHKTADLFRAAIRIGAIAGGASPFEIEALTTYGNNIGLAFQFIDDILDADDPGDDSFSCISLYGQDGARQIAAELTANAIEAAVQLKGNSTALVAIAKHMLERTF